MIYQICSSIVKSIKLKTIFLDPLDFSDDLTKTKLKQFEKKKLFYNPPTSYLARFRYSAITPFGICIFYQGLPIFFFLFLNLIIFLKENVNSPFFFVTDIFTIFLLYMHKIEKTQDAQKYPHVKFKKTTCSCFPISLFFSWRLPFLYVPISYHILCRLWCISYVILGL